MRSKLGVCALLGGMLLAGAASAGDANPDVGKAIAEIAARREAKADAEAKATAANAAREGQEGRAGAWSSNPGGGLSVRQK